MTATISETIWPEDTQTTLWVYRGASDLRLEELMDRIYDHFGTEIKLYDYTIEPVDIEQYDGFVTKFFKIERV